MSEEVKKKMSKGKKIALIVTSSVLALILLLVGGGLLALHLMTRGFSQGGTANDSTVAETSYGKLQGRVNNGVYNFLGVEYAHAEKLFQRAEKPQAWEGVKEAFSLGPVSLQSGFTSALSGMKYSNNCQNLNLWTPALDGEKRPVMVWLHGGGFASGSANTYQGEALAKAQNVVVVGVNHRLNAVGYFDLSAYGETYADSANVGMWDIIDSLEWIRDNIEAFGGDPDNVTVFGQSGGGAKVLALMTSPEAQGLFHKGIVQSGATETVGVHFTSKEASLELTEKILDRLGISRDKIDEIQHISYSALTDAGDAAMREVAEKYHIPAPFGGYGMEWEPVVDGDFLPTDPVTEDGFAEAGRDIPLLIGSNLFEWSFMPSEQVNVTDEIRAEFAKAYPNEPVSDARNTDTLIRFPMLKIMSHKADQGGANVYSYLFTYGNSNHGAEIPYVFHEGNSKMDDLMSSIWANFARYGVPSADGLENWEPYTRDGGACMILDGTSYLAHDHDKALLTLIDPTYLY